MPTSGNWSDSELVGVPLGYLCRRHEVCGRRPMAEQGKQEEYAIKQVGERYYPVIIVREAGGHYEIKNPLTGGILSYNNPEAAEAYIRRAREGEKG